MQYLSYSFQMTPYTDKAVAKQIVKYGIEKIERLPQKRVSLAESSINMLPELIRYKFFCVTYNRFTKHPDFASLNPGVNSESFEKLWTDLLEEDKINEVYT